MLEAVAFMFGIGTLCGVVLSLASKAFYVFEDPRIADVEDCLAGANCGGCGYAGCSAAAAAVVNGDEGPGICIISGPDTAASVASILGLSAGSAEPIKSFNNCEGGHRATDIYHYQGVTSCKAMATMYGGKRECHIGCLGFGDCVKACSFDAVVIGEDGYPEVDREKCVGCGACAKVCPKTIIEVKTMAERLLHFNALEDPLAPCRQECPAQIDIPKYIKHIKNKEYGEAVDTIRERNPLLLACGRVCPHPCEDYCRRGVEDDPVSINQLKRFVADFEMNSGTRRPIPCAPRTGKKIAIVGGGPSGLSCAYFLQRIGHDATIFEAMPKLGGMLRYGIPEYRLPKKVLDWEIESILNLGVKCHTHLKLGLDFGLGSLVATGFDAIFLGVGAWQDYKLGVTGEDLKGCYTGIDYLARVARGDKIKIGKSAAVIGGGNTAIDCARTLIRQGVEKVYLVYRRTRKEMPANQVEIDAADHEGIEFCLLAAPTRVIGDKDNKLTHLEYLKMELGEPDASGRRRPVPIEGSETQLQVDMLITAIGQSPDVSFTQNGAEARLKELNVTRWNTIGYNELTHQTDIPYVFTAGDAATGPSLVVDAIGGARKAARSIDLFLKGEEVTPVFEDLNKRYIPGTIFPEVPGILPSSRQEMPELPVKERIDSFVEADLVLSEANAQQEAKRCLECCRICYNPDPVIKKKKKPEKEKVA